MAKGIPQTEEEPSNMSDVWYSQRIAEMDIGEDSSAETIRKHMVK